MNKLFKLDLILLRMIFTFSVGFALASIVIKLIVSIGYLTPLDQNVLTFNFSDTFFLFLMIGIFFLHAQKYDTLRKHKMIEWYESLPVSKKEIINEDFFLVLIAHIIFVMFALLFYSVNDDSFKIHGIMMMFGISLIMNGCMLIIGIKNPLIYVILVGIGGTAIIFAFGFHYLIVMNDFNMHLNLRNNPSWYFYLYQLPYVITIIGIIVCIISLKWNIRH